MNPRSPTETLSSDEGQRLRTLVRERGERDALKLVGLRCAETLYRAAAEQPIARLTAHVIRHSLDRL